MSKILIKNLSKSYNGKPVLRGISLAIGGGELVALVGPSGCGKTTTLKIMAGLLTPDDGKILIDGRDITKQPPDKRDIVMVFQDNLLFPHMTVGENITFGLKMLGKSRGFRSSKLKELLALVQLPDIEKRYPAQLSGGQQQRVALARALALEPGVLLLDEPLSNLDPCLREDMRELISSLHQTLKMNMVFVTHDQEEAMLLADHIAVMFDGAISQYAAPRELYQHPATPAVANLLGPCNIISGIIKNHTFAAMGSEFPVNTAIEGKADAYVRAEQIDIINQTEGLPGIIKETNYIGGYTLCKIDVGGQIFIVRSNGYLDMKPNTPVGLRINWEQGHFGVRH